MDVPQQNFLAYPNHSERTLISIFNRNILDDNMRSLMDRILVLNHPLILLLKGIDSETHIWPCTYSFRCYSTCYKSNSNDLPHNKYTIID